MLKRPITYVDFNDEEQTETFYFNISKAELVEMEHSVVGSFTQMIQTIIDTRDNNKLIKEFKRLVLMAYGKKSEDGKRFIKTDELRDEFSQSAAYDVLFMELATDEKAAAEFLNGVLPKDLIGEIRSGELSLTSTTSDPA